MTIYDHILNNLRRHSWMRYDRHKAIKEMLKEKYTDVSWENLDDIAHDWLSYDRVFRLVQQENKEVQTENHDLNKNAREQNYELNVLGREMGYKELTEDEKFALFEPK